MELVSCWIEHPVRTLDQPFTYFSEGLNLEPGMRVKVGFGSQDVIGFVESVEPTEENAEEAEARLGVKLKPIKAVLDESSLMNEELHALALWMRETTLSTAISCFQSMLPVRIKPITSGRHDIIMERWVSCSEEEVSLTPKQLEAYQYIRDHQPLTYAAARKAYPNQVRQLAEKNALVLTEKEKEASDPVILPTSAPLKLTAEQQAAKQEIEGSSDDVYLVHGATGSGKTELYLQLAETALASGRQVLILVPEISLTPQMIERVTDRFGSELAIYHSALNDQEKYEQYRKVKLGKARIVVGTRSAVFLPFASLGLIVMDEEQDSSYKQENQPAYHCRDVAIWRGRYHHCKVILGSATPTLESYARALKKVYHLITLKERVNRTMPAVTIIPLKECMKQGQSYVLSDPLREKIAQRLQAHQQVILLLNRRGYTTSLRCRSCQSVILCPHCDLAMSYHRDEKILKCHTCGAMMPVPKYCPTCGQAAGYSSYGFGTERLEQEVQAVFPEARILRMDADTTSRKNSHERILKAFGRGDADILLGTQMIAKGLDYPNVTLVGVLNGDEGLNRTDYRSCETTFDLLMQAGGRSGRSAEPGEVVYQVFDPDHYAVQCAAHQDYETFFRMEMQFRHAGQYPPYSYLVALTAVDTTAEKAEETGQWLKERLQSSRYKTIGVLSLLKVQDHYRSRVILKGRDVSAMTHDIRALLDGEERQKAKGVRIDVNPIALD